MHSGFISPEETLIHFDKTELDDLPNAEHIPMNFSVSVPITVSTQDKLADTNSPWKQQPKPRNAQVLFGSTLEYEENVDNFSK